MKIAFFLLFIFSASHSFSQDTPTAAAKWSAYTNANIHVEKLNGDSLSTSFLIQVRDSVPRHYHAYHSEHIYVLSGRAEMQIDTDTVTISPGDYLFVPAKTWHGVYVPDREILRVLSIQAPEFSGEDRVLEQ